VEELDGKSDDAHMIFAAPDQIQFDEWCNSITICITTIESKRRKSTIITSPQAIMETQSLNTSNSSAIPSQSNNGGAPAEQSDLLINPHNLNKTLFPSEEEVPAPSNNPLAAAAAAAAAARQAKLAATTPQPTEEEVPAPSNNPLAAAAAAAAAARQAKLAATTPQPTEEEVPAPSNNPLAAAAEKLAATSSSQVEVDGASVNELSQSTDGESDSKKSGSQELIPEEVRTELQKRGSMKIFKPPTKLGNLLNKKGLNPEAIKQAEQQLQQAMTVQTNVSDSEPSKPAPTPIPRELLIKVRPMDPVRMGYLKSLTSKELGEDGWIVQYVSLTIASGMLEYFAEIGG